MSIVVAVRRQFLPQGDQDCGFKEEGVGVRCPWKREREREERGAQGRRERARVRVRLVYGSRTA